MTASAAERRQLFVHPGFAKTASSALQLWLDANAAALAEAGIHYAIPARRAADAPGRISSGNGKPLAQYLVPELRGPDFDLEGFADRFRARFIDARLPISLVSNEHMASWDPDMLRRFREEIVPDLDLTFVIFIRDLYGSARSTWMQGIKRRAATVGFKEYMSCYVPRPVHQLREIVEVLGRENVRLLHYDSVADDVVGAFFGALDLPLPSSAGPTRVGLINRSLSDTEARVLIECNKRHRHPKLARRLSDHLLERYPGGTAPHAPDSATLAALGERFADEIGWVNETFFDGRRVFGAGRAAGPDMSETDSEELDDAQVWKDVALFLAGQRATPPIR